MSQDRKISLTSTDGGAAGATSGYDSDGRASTPSLELSDDGEPRRPPQNPSQMALPTMLMAGTILGSIFRADLSKNKVDVETNNLRKRCPELNPDVPRVEEKQKSHTMGLFKPPCLRWDKRKINW